MPVENALFISYSHADMSPTHWLERLKLYLASVRRLTPVDIWDDTRLQVGGDWRQQIKTALEHASAAILLVGPGFLASEFIMSQELPALLTAARTRGAKIYPLVVGYCAYKRSVLEPYQAFNDPDKPLEALPAADQNKALNDLALLIDQDLRHAAAQALPAQPADLRALVQKIRRHLDDTRTAFTAQCRRRNDLVKAIRSRLRISERLEYEKFFFRYYPRLNDEERFEFEQIRAMTEGPLYEGNRQILATIEEHPELMDEIPALQALRQHLVLWINKYERVFLRRSEMCLLYTGVEDGVPFPKEINAILDNWLAARKESGP